VTCREWVLPVDAHQLLYTPMELVLVLILAHHARVANMSRKCAGVPDHLATIESTGSRFGSIVLSATKQTTSTHMDCIRQPTPALADANVTSVVPSNECGLSRSVDSLLGHHIIHMAIGTDQAHKASDSRPLHAVAATWREPETGEAPPSRQYNLLHRTLLVRRKRPMTPPIMGHQKLWLKQRAGLLKFKTQWQQVRPASGSLTSRLAMPCVTTAATGAGALVRPFQGRLTEAWP
jgi:hypothetical protein